MKSLIDLEIELLYKSNIIKKINRFISTNSSEFNINNLNNKYDYVFDGLNIEGGSINSFLSIKKIIKKNKLIKKKILIILRSSLKKQTKKEDNFCKRLVKKFNNIDIIYIHTSIDIKNKNYKLIESCRHNPYCNNKEKNSKEILCVTPIVIENSMRPTHNMCEIDDLLVYYFGLFFNSKIVSRTENYSTNIKERNIHSFKLFLNIPITHYNKDKTNKKWIDPIFVFKHLKSLYKIKQLSSKQVIMIKKGIKI